MTANNLQHHQSSRPSTYGAWRLSVSHASATRLRTPNLSDDGAMSAALATNNGEGGDTMAEEDPRHAVFRERYNRTESRLDAVLNGLNKPLALEDATAADGLVGDDARPPETAPPASAPKKPARTIDEDDYGDDDEDNDEDEASNASPLLCKSAPPSRINSISIPLNLQVPSPQILKPGIERKASSSSDHVKNAEEIRKNLEEEKKALEETVQRRSYTMFHTLESDRDAMLEQEKLDELDRQVESEMNSGAPNAARQDNMPRQGTLSTENLGSSSLTLKNLIAAIDKNRDRIPATQAQLRQMLGEARKNRSKWASEDKVGQEELYEACEKVLMELKAREHATPFLNKVSKREAPDYYNIIKRPMDIGTMLKKLKGVQYKSKKEFVEDLSLIWDNCLRYNSDPAHLLRKKALYMRKETEKIVPLIPDIVIRDRAEVEAEERRLQNGDDADGIEDSDDEEPIMASRGRKAPGKMAKKGGSTTRKALPTATDSSPVTENKVHTAHSVSNLKHEFLRADSDAPMEGSQNGVSTPPPGTLTPMGPHALFNGAHGSQADPSEADVHGGSLTGLAVGQTEDPDVDDIEYKTWKQVTKKDRALMAAERHRLFRNDHLNPEEPAILRTRAGMRRWTRQRQIGLGKLPSDKSNATEDSNGGTTNSRNETLAEGIEVEDDTYLPDYYDPVSAIPDINERLQWVEDGNGQVIDQSEEFLRMAPRGIFVSPQSTFTQKMEANMRQMQDVRKICAKIGVVKQMQLQSQMYQNQFQKYDPQPFIEEDAEPIVMTDDGPIMSQHTVRAALQRSVAKIFYHTGFEEFQPSALDSITDLASNYFTNLAKTLLLYREAPKVKDPVPAPDGRPSFRPRFTNEEAVLHCLSENGTDVESLDDYVKNDVDRIGTKLGVMQERMKSHLAELLRPALDSSAGADGVGAFKDGSEQFVGGDFAEEIGEDFFGFKELGLDKEFGLASLAVPLHLLQNRMYTAHQSQNANSNLSLGIIMEQPAPYEPVTINNINSQIGLVQDFFLARLESNNNEELVEDDDLPLKQRFPKPRLPPTGKITSPRKRPIREQQQLAKKKRKLEEGKAEEMANATSVPEKIRPIGKLQLKMPPPGENMGDPEKEDGSAVGMMSPESLTAA
ncbi:transcriptional activator spt7 [Patellaria atrata CBS 101060]|uniref:SAGA complex subunit Spt7 n=1 Tax=Patellaria atrata CBS 101060 TaxID=1346257 RepID=A0A9P4VLQ8_9PEZI|nr:transcriptional activator spt7 [Patellaria atrata CBS 101060]